MCTTAITILYSDHEIHSEVLPTKTISVTVDGTEKQEFPLKEDWFAIERNDEDTIMLALPEIELEVTFSKDNHGFTIRLPSHLFFNKTEGLCGKIGFFYCYSIYLTCFIIFCQF